MCIKVPQCIILVFTESYGFFFLFGEAEFCFVKDRSFFTTQLYPVVFKLLHC